MSVAAVFARGVVLGLASLLLAAVFGWSALAKLRDVPGTVESFRAMGLRRPLFLARVIPVVELGVGVWILLAPWVGASLAFAMLVGFTLVILSVIRSGVVVRCACFGATSAAPLGWGGVVRNLILMALSVVVALQA